MCRLLVYTPRSRRPLEAIVGVLLICLMSGTRLLCHLEFSKLWDLAPAAKLAKLRDVGAWAPGQVSVHLPMDKRLIQRPVAAFVGFR